MTKELSILSLKRAVWTFLQVVLSMITVGVAIWEIEWVKIASIAATAALYSFIKSIVVGVPENIKTDGVLIVDDSDEEKTKWLFNVETDLDDIYKKKSINLVVKNKEE